MTVMETTGPSVLPTSTLTIRRVEKIFRVEGQNYGLPQFPDGNVIVDKAPWSGCFERLIAAAKPRNIPCVPSAHIARGKTGSPAL